MVLGRHERKETWLIRLQVMGLQEYDVLKSKIAGTLIRSMFAVTRSQGAEGFIDRAKGFLIMKLLSINQ